MKFREYTTQLLIVGGAISGLSVALTAKEANPGLDVLIADKCDASYGFSGKSSRTAGLLSFVTREDDPEDFVKFCTETNGYYLNDQDLLRAFANSTDEVIGSLKRWGVDIPSGPDGYPEYLKWPYPWGTASVDPDMCVSMAARAKELGVRYLERVTICRLLTENGVVTGAAGFSLREEELVVIRANTVVLACGSQNYDITKTWCATGNAILMAYEAGAEMRNCEFGNMCDFAAPDPRGWVYYAAAHTAHDHLYVGDVNISQKYRPGMHSSMDPLAAYAWYRETVAGNTVEASIEEFEQTEGKSYFKKHEKAVFRHEYTSRLEEGIGKGRFPVIPGFIGELSCIRVDHTMASTRPNLYAVGDTSGGGTARAGAVATPPGKIHGTGIYNAAFTGITAGKYAGRAAALHPAPALRGCEPEDKALGEEFFRPLHMTRGLYVRDMIGKVQDIISPTDYSLVKNGDRMNRALGRTMELRELLGEVYVNDLHELAKYVDLCSMVLGSELFYRASLARTESRGFHLRDDCPETDNEHWLKWVLIRKQGDGMTISTEDIPMERYRYHPAEKQVRVVPIDVRPCTPARDHPKGED